MLGWYAGLQLAQAAEVWLRDPVNLVTSDYT